MIITLTILSSAFAEPLPPVAPLSGLSQKEICSSNELLLIQHSYEHIQTNFQSICCHSQALGEDHIMCMMDWPFNDVPYCNSYDIMRNAIFARYGYTFKSERWSQHFSNYPWYKPRTDFSDQWMSETAKLNVVTLKKQKKEHIGCTPEP